MQQSLVPWRMGLGPLVGQFMMLVTTTGRRSGLPRHATTPYFFVNGKKYVYADREAQWVQNVEADPLLTIQTAYGTERVKAVPVSDSDELTAVYVNLMNQRPWLAEQISGELSIQSIPEDVGAHAGKLPLLTFEPTEQPTPPALKADLRWLWLVIFAVFWLRGRRKR